MAVENNNTSEGIKEDNLVIPLIDFSAFLHGKHDTRLSTAQSIYQAFQTSGFLYLCNHGIPPATVHDVFQKSALFFHRSQAQKDSLRWTTPRSNRGYVTLGREKVTQSADPTEILALRTRNPDLKESMEIGREGVPDSPNRWPDQLDPAGVDFTRTMQSFFLACKDLHVQVMRAIALGMGLEDGGAHFFDRHTDGGDNTLRLLHYPPVPKSVFADNPDRVRAGEHSDYGSITLLFQDNVGGLEVKSPEGAFVGATPIKDTIVVNAGDLLSRWSNDRIKSTKHRVVQPPATGADDDGDGDGDEYPERYSIAYFCNPNFDSFIEALPGTWEESGGKRYEGIKSGEYLERRLAATY